MLTLVGARDLAGVNAAVFQLMRTAYLGTARGAQVVQTAVHAFLLPYFWRILLIIAGGILLWRWASTSIIDIVKPEAARNVYFTAKQALAAYKLASLVGAFLIALTGAAHCYIEQAERPRKSQFILSTLLVVAVFSAMGLSLGAYGLLIVNDGLLNRLFLAAGIALGCFGLLFWTLLAMTIAYLIQIARNVIRTSWRGIVQPVATLLPEVETRNVQEIFPTPVLEGLAIAAEFIANSTLYMLLMALPWGMLVVVFCYPLFAIAWGIVYTYHSVTGWINRQEPINQSDIVDKALRWYARFLFVVAGKFMFVDILWRWVVVPSNAAWAVYLRNLADHAGDLLLAKLNGTEALVPGVSPWAPWGWLLLLGLMAVVVRSAFDKEHQPQLRKWSMVTLGVGMLVCLALAGVRGCEGKRGLRVAQVIPIDPEANIDASLPTDILVRPTSKQIIEWDTSKPASCMVQLEDVSEATAKTLRLPLYEGLQAQTSDGLSHTFVFNNLHDGMQIPFLVQCTNRDPNSKFNGVSPPNLKVYTLKVELPKPPPPPTASASAKPPPPPAVVKKKKAEDDELQRRIDQDYKEWRAEQDCDDSECEEDP